MQVVFVPQHTHLVVNSETSPVQLVHPPVSLYIAESGKSEERAVRRTVEI